MLRHIFSRRYQSVVHNGWDFVLLYFRLNPGIWTFREADSPKCSYFFNSPSRTCFSPKSALQVPIWGLANAHFARKTLCTPFTRGFSVCLGRVKASANAGVGGTSIGSIIAVGQQVGSPRLFFDRTRAVENKSKVGLIIPHLSLTHI